MSISLPNDIEHTTDQNDTSDQSGQNDQNAQPTTTHPSMTTEEKTWWAMSFEDLFLHAREKSFGKSDKESRKSGRVRIIQWLCKKNGITPYTAPSITPTVTSETIPAIARSTGAISHPEAILWTTDPALQLQINKAEAQYLLQPTADLITLAMSRSYQLLKDSQGKLPSKSKAAIANWLASWDVLKSEREKGWWVGDGIDLANKAKAMGYKGSVKKYDVIVWLRSTPEDLEIREVAEPTPNEVVKRKVVENEEEGGLRPVHSKRYAKGSTRSNTPSGYDLKIR